MSSDDISYYRDYYDKMGDAAYLGEKLKTSSRMLVFAEWIRELVPAGGKVLDLGGGDMIFSELIPEYEWWGQDINLERAHRIPKERRAEHDTMKQPYPYEKGFFDAVITSEHLEHVWDPRIAHREVRRILKRDGSYIISTPNFDWIQNHLEHYRRIMQVSGQSWTWEHIRHLNYDTHKALLNECGFVIEKHTGSDAHYCPVFASASRAVRDGLRKQGVDVSEELIHKWVGEGVPYYQHTIHLACKKA